VGIQGGLGEGEGTIGAGLGMGHEWSTHQYCCRNRLTIDDCEMRITHQLYILDKHRKKRKE